MIARSGPLIKIRYADLPAGLHVRTEDAGRHVVIYLLPGLSSAERRAALRRARSGALVGHGPALSRGGLARAIAADWLRTGAANGVAALRAHPALFVPPMIIIVSAAVAYLLLTSVSVRIEQPPAVSPQPGVAVVPELTAPRTAAGYGGTPGSGTPSRTTPVSYRTSGHPHVRPSPRSPASPRPSQPAGRIPNPRRSLRPTATATPSATATATSPPASPPPSPAPGGSGQHCLQLGPLGVCLRL
jgi:hypothetical protein